VFLPGTSSVYGSFFGGVGGGWAASQTISSGVFLVLLVLCFFDLGRLVGAVQKPAPRQ